jgi:hypothetical protein
MQAQTAHALRKPITTQPLRLRSVPLEDRATSQKLQGKSVCIVIDDADYAAGMKELVQTMLGPISDSASVSIVNWSTFLAILPEMRADLVVALSPRDLKMRLPDLESGLLGFRKANAGAVVLMNNLHSPAASASEGLGRLLKDSLLDHVEHGYTFFPILVHQGAQALEAKV